MTRRKATPRTETQSANRESGTMASQQTAVSRESAGVPDAASTPTSDSLLPPVPRAPVGTEDESADLRIARVVLRDLVDCRFTELRRDQGHHLRPCPAGLGIYLKADGHDLLFPWCAIALVDLDGGPK